jgi:hypothetical protein
VLITLVFNQAITVVAAKQRIGIGKMPKQKENMLDASIEFNPRSTLSPKNEPSLPQSPKQPTRGYSTERTSPPGMTSRFGKRKPQSFWRIG